MKEEEKRLTNAPCLIDTCSRLSGCPSLLAACAPALPLATLAAALIGGLRESSAPELIAEPSYVSWHWLPVMTWHSRPLKASLTSIIEGEIASAR